MRHWTMDDRGILLSRHCNCHPARRRILRAGNKEAGSCPGSGASANAFSLTGPELAGKVVKCPGCSAKIRLPDAAPIAPPAPVAPDEEQELQLERNEAEVPLAASVPTSDGAAPSGFPLSPGEQLTEPSVRQLRRCNSRSERGGAGLLERAARRIRVPGQGRRALRADRGRALSHCGALRRARWRRFSFTGVILAIGIYAFSHRVFRRLPDDDHRAHRARRAGGAGLAGPDRLGGERAEAVRLHSGARHPLPRPVPGVPAFGARTEHDARLRDPRRGAVLHADGLAVRRSGERLRRTQPDSGHSARSAAFRAGTPSPGRWSRSPSRRGFRAGSCLPNCRFRSSAPCCSRRSVATSCSSPRGSWGCSITSPGRSWTGWQGRTN